MPGSPIPGIGTTRVLQIESIVASQGQGRVMMDALPLSSCILILYIPDKCGHGVYGYRARALLNPPPDSRCPLYLGMYIVDRVLVALADGRIFDRSLRSE